VAEENTETCPCLFGKARFDAFATLATDDSLPTGGFEISRCRQCHRVWLKLRYEIESISRSGRWFSGVISEDSIVLIDPENVVAVLTALPWHLCGGSYFDGNVSRRTGSLLL
jgi:hypothetical protein